MDGIPVSDLFLSEFLNKVTSGDDFTFIIKGHLYIEALVTCLIEYAFLRPLELELDRMTYDRKVILCMSAGLIHEDVAPALRKLGKIRNNFVHSIWPDFTRKEERDFLNTLRQSKRLRQELAQSGPTWEGLQAAIWVLWIYLFGQLCSITSSRELLSEFWSKVVDAVNAPICSTTSAMPVRPIKLGKSEFFALKKMNIYVGNLSDHVTQDDLRKAFEKFGQVESLAVMKDKDSGKPRGFGFVKMPHEVEAQRAISSLNGKILKGQVIKVTEVRRRTGHRRGRGGRGRRRRGGACSSS